MNHEITQEELWAEQEVSLVKLISSILPNELLFSLFYLLGEWSRRITLVKLCKILNVTDEKLIKDHLNMLLRSGLLVKTAEQYQISATGRHTLQLLNDAVGNIPDRSWIAFSASADSVASVGQPVMGAVNSADASRLISTSMDVPPDQKIVSDREFPLKSPASSETTISLAKEAVADAA